MPDKIPADSVDGKLPTILYLPGSGAFGSASEVATLVRQRRLTFINFLVTSANIVINVPHPGRAFSMALAKF